MAASVSFTESPKSHYAVEENNHKILCFAFLCFSLLCFSLLSFAFLSFVFLFFSFPFLSFPFLSSMMKNLSHLSLIPGLDPQLHRKTIHVLQNPVIPYLLLLLLFIPLVPGGRYNKSGGKKPIKNYFKIKNTVN